MEKGPPARAFLLAAALLLARTAAAPGLARTGAFGTVAVTVHAAHHGHALAVAHAVHLVPVAVAFAMRTLRGALTRGAVAGPVTGAVASAVLVLVLLRLDRRLRLGARLLRVRGTGDGEREGGNGGDGVEAGVHVCVSGGVEGGPIPPGMRRPQVSTGGCLVTQCDGRRP